MAYTPVPAFFVDDIIDEIFLNTFWRDNMAAGVPDIFSAKGDLPVGLGVDSVGVLPVGTNDQVLAADSSQATGLKWKDLKTVTNRQGGNATNWNTQGTTNYVPASSQMQVGVRNVTANTASGSIFHGNTTVTFPVAFSAVPVVFACSLDGFFDLREVSASPTASQVTLVIISAINNLTTAIAWMAIGA